MIKIYDKAEWQIDNGVEKQLVIDHFINIFEWLDEKNYLSEDGEEMLDDGIDSSISLNEDMVKKDILDFLDKYYDKIIKESNYDLAIEKNLLDKYYNEYKCQ